LTLLLLLVGALLAGALVLLLTPFAPKVLLLPAEELHLWSQGLHCLTAEPVAVEQAASWAHPDLGLMPLLLLKVKWLAAQLLEMAQERLQQQPSVEGFQAGLLAPEDIQNCAHAEVHLTCRMLHTDFTCSPACLHLA
jgi:hypothetical protein